MRVGVSGFIGGKLTEARQARGIASRKALADMLERAASTVTRWEDGTLSPEPAALDDICRVLALPADFFLSERTAESGTRFFRSYASALKSDRAMQGARLVWLMDLAEVAEYYAYLPEVRISRPFALGGHRSLRDEDIEAIAGQIRSDWGIGLKPIVDLLPQMERSGIVIAAETMDTVKLDGLSAWDERSARPFVLLANDKQSYARRQFDAAHELGHIVLHRGLSEDELVSDFEMIEDQANKFASALLLPAAQYSLEVTDLNLWGLERLKARWRVSIKAQIMRLRQLNILDGEAATRLFKGYSARGFSRGEPYDDVWKLQQPSLLGDIFNAVTADDGISRQELLANLPFRAHDAERLAGLPPGWFSRSTGHVVQLRDFRAKETSRSGS